MNILEFCTKHKACEGGQEWALANCTDMQSAWDTTKPEWLIWIATREGVLTDKELRLFAVFCARQVEHLLTDERSRNAINVAEKFANGLATREELEAAWAAARAAAWAAAGEAARAAAWAAAGEAAAWAAAWAAARAAAWAAAWAAAGEAAAWAAAVDAAREAARAAARAAAGEAAVAAAGAAAVAAQKKWLRENTKPNFNIGGE